MYHSAKFLAFLTSLRTFKLNHFIKTSTLLHCWSSAPASLHRELWQLWREAAEGFPFGLMDFFTLVRQFWHHIPPALVQLEGNLIWKRNSMQTNIQFGNLRVGAFYTLEDFCSYFITGAPDKLKRDELFLGQRNPYI